MNRRVKVAVIGSGPRADDIAAAFRTMRLAELHLDGSSVAEIVADDRIDAVAIATSAESHAELAWQALAAGKHVFVTSPLALSGDAALSLVDLSERVGRCLLVEHPLVFNEDIRKLREFVELGRLGRLYTICSTALERRRGHEDDGGVLWSVGPDQVAALLYLLADVPVEVTAYAESDGTDVVSCGLQFPDGVGAHLHLSRLDASPCRRLTIIGSSRVVIFDDLEPGRQEPARATDYVVPHISPPSPLKTACETFLTAINRRYPLLDETRAAAMVVCVLEAIERSFRAGGTAERIAVQPATPLLENVVSISTPHDPKRLSDDASDEFHRSNLPL